jgi:hypothetical protein
MAVVVAKALPLAEGDPLAVPVNADDPVAAAEAETLPLAEGDPLAVPVNDDDPVAAAEAETLALADGVPVRVAVAKPDVDGEEVDVVELREVGELEGELVDDAELRLVGEVDAVGVALIDGGLHVSGPLGTQELSSPSVKMTDEPTAGALHTYV